MFCMHCGKPIQFREDLPDLEIADCTECNTRYEMTPHDDQDGSMSVLIQHVEPIDLVVEEAIEDELNTSPTDT